MPLGGALVVAMKGSVARFASKACGRVASVLGSKSILAVPYLPPEAGEGLWLGKETVTNKKAFLGLEDLAGHALVAGDSGQENAIAASVLVESALDKGVAVVVFDPKARWTGFLKPCGDRELLGRYAEFGMGESDARHYKGRVIEAEGPSLRIDPQMHAAPGEITVFAMDGLPDGGYARAASCAIGWLLADKQEGTNPLKLLVVFDEAQLLLKKDAGALRKACAGLGGSGVGLLLVSDSAGELGGSVLTEVQLNTKASSDVKRLCGLHGVEYGRRATMLAPGVAMLHNPRYNGGRPWCVAIRPPRHSPHGMPPSERETYKKQGRALEELEQRIALLKRGGTDTADLELELMVAKKKLRGGHLKMAEMYAGFLRKRLCTTE